MLFEQQQRLAVEGAREVENGFDESVRDYNSHMPFAFRVQPMQPNLQERIWYNNTAMPYPSSSFHHNLICISQLFNYLAICFLVINNSTSLSHSTPYPYASPTFSLISLSLTPSQFSSLLILFKNIFFFMIYYFLNQTV